MAAGPSPSRDPNGHHPGTTAGNSLPGQKDGSKNDTKIDTVGVYLTHDDVVNGKLTPADAILRMWPNS